MLLPTNMHVDVTSFSFYENFNFNNTMADSYEYDPCPFSASPTASMSTPSPSSSTSSAATDYSNNSYCDQNQVDMNLFGPFTNTANLLDSLSPISKVEDQQQYSRRSVKRPKRKRVITGVQRKAANVRERKRMLSINDAFDELRKKVPETDNSKGLSRIQTLKHAIVYISYLKDVLNGKQAGAEVSQHQPEQFDVNSAQSENEYYL